ncbi:MAG TPA: potassium channel family protein [Pyrinomonadaceae bacterium]|nr:potassium channel family protein [Pyrinomonadaceae bacterium]
MIRVLVAIASFAVIVVVLWDAFETIVLPRRVTRRLRVTTFYYSVTWRPWRSLVRLFRTHKRREVLLSVYGPLSLLALIVLWAIGLVFAFGLLHWSIGTPLNIAADSADLTTYLYMSGVVFFTLGFGDVTPVGGVGRMLTVLQSGLGFGVLAIVIGYLPVLYQAFSRREANISLLDARAGTPPTAAELLRRHGRAGNMKALDKLLSDWEVWSADLMESHLSYPVLCFFRSQHDNQSWLSSLTTILDSCALVMVGVDNAPTWQAQLTFAMARHTVVDLSQISDSAPLEWNDDRLPPAELARLRLSLAADNVPLNDGADADARLAELRRMYEPYVASLADHLAMPLPPWIHERDAVDNWQTSAFERNPHRVAETVANACRHARETKSSAAASKHAK